MEGGSDDAEAILSDAQTMEHGAESEEQNPSHWAHYSTDQLEQLLGSLEAMEQGPLLTVDGVKAELVRRRDPAAPA
jgi:hypothetical protein